MTFGIQVRNARDVLHLTQDELAATLAVDKQSVSNWECERNRPWPKEQVRILTLLLELQRQHLAGRQQQRERVCDRI